MTTDADDALSGAVLEPIATVRLRVRPRLPEGAEPPHRIGGVDVPTEGEFELPERFGRAVLAMNTEWYQEVKEKT
jgi:hypothetical protein